MGKTEYENDITYLGATWGADGDTVYFLKQIVVKKKTTGPLSDVLGGGTETLGSRIWFCKMNGDGTHKKEIAELWPGQVPHVDIQSGPVWMEINGVSSQAVFGVEYGVRTVGIWVMGMDGKNLHRPFEITSTNAETRAVERLIVVHPSWNPERRKLVFCEHGQGMHLAVYDLVEKERRQLTDEPRDEQPVWSPKGDWIASLHCLRCDDKYADPRIWLVLPDGTEQAPVTNEKGKPIKGWWPSWSPDAQ